MPAPVKITLSHEEKKQLEKNITSRKTAVRLVERSKIILLAADNVPNYRIALQLGIGVNKVGRWRNRYADRGMQGIEKDLPRGANHGGKDTAEQAKLRSKIIKMTTQEKPKDGTHWSTGRRHLKLQVIEKRGGYLIGKLRRQGCRRRDYMDVFTAVFRAGARPAQVR